MSEAKFLMEKEKKEKEMEMKLMASDIGATPEWMFLLMLAIVLGMVLFMIGTIINKLFFS